MILKNYMYHIKYFYLMLYYCPLPFSLCVTKYEFDLSYYKEWRLYFVIFPYEKTIRKFILI